MSETRHCPQCGSELPADAPEGMCPKCLLALGIGSQAPAGSADTAAYGGEGKAPPPAALAKYFPELEIIELLGQGGMGMVYKARQRSLDRLVALKILPPEVRGDATFAERFLREARALARMSHPNIVAVHDFGERGGLYFFLMEYVDGANLRQMIQAGRMAPRDALAIVPRICEALQFAHEEGVIHRDIKPENILVDKKGRVKIADFGLAKLLGKAPAAPTLTAAGQAMGTAHYMAPEQIERPLAVDHRPDIYSLGVVLYEMLTGELPIGRFAPPSQKVQVDIRLDEVVLRALEKEPARRFQHVSEVKTEVESICGLGPAAVARLGYEYRSKATFLGWPLVHIATGFDPATGRKRVAKGIIAIGDMAVGGLALGGAAAGGIAIGGASMGLVSFGGIAIALILAIGGAAIGAVAIGGGAVGGIAVGGMAVGYYAYGGAAYGVHALGSNVRDPGAVEFFGPLTDRFFGPLTNGSFWVNWSFSAMQAFFIGFVALMIIISVGVTLAMRLRQRVPVSAVPSGSRSRAYRAVEPTKTSGPAPESAAAVSADITQQVRGPALGLIWTALLNWIGLFVALGIGFWLYAASGTSSQLDLRGLLET